MSIFWAVWRKDGGSAPTKRHATKLEAVTEASRLATQTRASYYVLQVIGIVDVPDVPYEYISLNEEER